MSSVPVHDYPVAQEEIISFHDKCVKRGTVGLYIDLIEYYCRNTAHDYTKHSHLFTTNVLNYMNDPDKKLIGRVIASFTSILGKLQVENKWALVPRIRDAMENAGLGAPADDFLVDAMGINLYSRSVNAFTMLETKEGVKSITGVIIDAILHGSLPIRQDTAFCFKYLIEFADPKALKTEVIKICGALIRVSNDKFPPELKIELFLALRLMLVKAGALVRAMVA